MARGLDEGTSVHGLLRIIWRPPEMPSGNWRYGSLAGRDVPPDEPDSANAGSQIKVDLASRLPQLGTLAVNQEA